MFSCEPPTSQHVMWPHRNILSCEPPTSHVIMQTAHIATSFHVNRPHCDMFSCELPTSQHVFMWTANILTCFHVNMFSCEPPTLYITTYFNVNCPNHIVTYFHVNHPHCDIFSCHIATCLKTNHTQCDSSSTTLVVIHIYIITISPPHMENITGSYCTFGPCPFPSFPTFPSWVSRRAGSWRSVGRRAVRWDWRGRRWRRIPSSWSCRHSWSESGGGDRWRWTRAGSRQTIKAWEYSWFNFFTFQKKLKRENNIIYSTWQSAATIFMLW